MNEEEKKALELLKDKAREAAMGVAEETEVYQNAENIIRKHPVLAATVKSIVDKEIGAEFDIGENKSIGFMYKPEEKKAQLGFKMSFDEGGFLGKYQSQGMVKLSSEFENMTIDNAFERLKKVGSKGEEKAYESARKNAKKILKILYPDKDFKSILVKDFSMEDAENFYRKADELNIGEGTMKKFSAAISASGRGQKSGLNPFILINDIPGRKEELYPRKTKMTGTPIQDFGKNDETIRKAFDWFDESMNPIMKREIGKTRVASNISGSNVRLAKIVSLTGLRPVDITRLRLVDIDEAKGFIRYLSAKGAVGPNLPISREAMNLIVEQIDEVGEGISKQGNRIFGLFGSGDDILSANIDAKAYESNWSKQLRKAHTNKKLSIYDESIKAEIKDRAYRVYDARSYHGSKLLDAGEEANANKIMGWATKETRAESKMLQEVYGQTARKKLNVTMSPTNINLKKIVDAKEAEIFKTIGYTPEKIKNFSTVTKTAKTFEDKTKKVASQVDDVFKSEKVTIPEKTTTQITPDVKTEPVTKTEPVSMPEEPKTSKGRKIRKFLSTTAMASILSKITKAATVFAPVDGLQIANELLGGSEGLYKKKLFGIFPPTLSQDIKETNRMLGIETPEVVNKTQDEQINKLMPEKNIGVSFDEGKTWQ